MHGVPALWQERGRQGRWALSKDMGICRFARPCDGMRIRISTFVLSGAGTGDHLAGQHAPRADPWVCKETKLSLVRKLAMRLISRLVGEYLVKEKGRCLHGIEANIVTLTTGLTFQAFQRKLRQRAAQRVLPPAQGL